jgi:hypothetical protein
MKLIQSKAMFFLCWLTLALAKFALVAHNEIIAIQDDSAVYATQATGPWTLSYPPGYPLWLRLCLHFNVPQRLAIEFFYLVAVLVVGYAIKRCFGTAAGFASVILLAISPSTYFLFDLGLTDAFFTCLSLLALALTIDIFISKTLLNTALLSIGLGAVFGLMAITRNEDPLLAFWVLLLVVARAILQPNTIAPIRQWRYWVDPILAGALATAAAGCVVFALCFSYYLTQGVFARGIALIPGHQLLLKNLAQIKTGEPEMKWVPITHRSREMAYAVSPTLAKYRSLIENPQDGWQVISRQFGGAPMGEIGGGWIWHAINLKILAQGGEKPAAAEAEYTKINAEMKAAFQDGRLKKRFIVHPLIGGNLKGLFGELPPSISGVVTCALSALPSHAVDQNYLPDLFDSAYVRRAALVPKPEVKVQGWAFITRPGHKILNVTVTSDAAGRASVKALDRPDVVNVFSKTNGWKPEVNGFLATLHGPSAGNIKVRYILDDGSQLQSEDLKSTGGRKVVNTSVPGDDILQFIDKVELPDTAVPDSRHQLESAFLRRFESKSVTRMAVATFAVAFLLSGYMWIARRDQVFEPGFIFLVFALLSWVARIFFYSLIDARGWNAQQIRYLAPANALGFVIFSVSLGVFFTTIKRGISFKQKLPKPEPAVAACN